MSRILAQSVTADLCGRLFNRLLFVILLPIILAMAFLPPRERSALRAVPAQVLRGKPARPGSPQGDLKPGP